MRITQSIALPILATLLSGCYTLQPVERATPVIGTEVAVDLNDAGRAALGPSIGREGGQVHGHRIQRDSDDYAMAVTSVDFIRGGSQAWTGEVVHVKYDYTNAYYVNRVSKSRTIGFAAALTAAIVVGARQALTVDGLPADAPTNPPDEGTKQRVPSRGIRIPVNVTGTLQVLRHLVPILVRF
ncbi:MAG: hypothetical protein ABI205_04555 [Gemmatimonadaceae bacterium]